MYSLPGSATSPVPILMSWKRRVKAVFRVPSAGGTPGGGIKTQESYLVHLMLAGWAGTSAAGIGLGGATAAAAAVLDSEAGVVACEAGAEGVAGLAAGAGFVGVWLWAKTAVAQAAINRAKNVYFIAW